MKIQSPKINSNLSNVSLAIGCLLKKSCCYHILTRSTIYGEYFTKTGARSLYQPAIKECTQPLLNLIEIPHCIRHIGLSFRCNVATLATLSYAYTAPLQALGGLCSATISGLPSALANQCATISQNADVSQTLRPHRALLLNHQH